MRLAEDIVASFCRRFFFSASTGRLFVGVGRKHPFTMRKASLMGFSLKEVKLFTTACRVTVIGS